MARSLLDLRTSKGRRIRLIQFPHAPIATLRLGNLDANTPPACVINVIEARGLRDALSEFIVQVEEAGGDPTLEPTS